MKFKELKEDLLKRAKAESACKEGYEMGLDATCKKDLLNAITANWGWVMNFSKMIDVAYLEAHFTQKELIAANIYTTGQLSIFSGVAYACGSSTVKACGSSTVKACGSSTVKACGSSTVKACGSSTVEAYDSSTVEAYDSSTVEAYDSSTVEAYGSSTVKACGSSTVKAYGSSTVEAYDSSTVKAYDNAYVEDCTGNITKPSDYAIIKDYCSHKIYIKKGQFEIIEVE